MLERAMSMAERTVRVDLHVHSAASWDCRVPPREVAVRCRSLGLGPVFLTDHDSIAGAQELRRHDPHGAVVGQEVTTLDGELIGLFLERPVEPDLRPEEAARRIKEQGGLVYLQHPYDRRRRSLPEDAIERLAGQIDVVEVFNARCDGDANRRAEDLCEIIDAAPGAGSDAHTLDEIGAVYVEMAAFSDPRDFLAKLRRATIVRDPPRWRMRLQRWAPAPIGRR
jgi:predicted metal-dependent phosphoesterase TrpH